MISLSHNPFTQGHELSLYLNWPGRVWSHLSLNCLHLLCKVTEAKPWPAPSLTSGSFIQGSVSLGSDFTSQAWSKCPAVLVWSWLMRLGAWGFRGTPTQGVAMPVADFEAGGKGPLVVSFRCGLGVQVIPTVCSCLDASHLKWKETGTHLPACAQGLNRYEQKVRELEHSLLDLLFLL